MRNGLTLIEVLLAIIILGIGLVSIAALFPAGIMQQRRSTDDIMGPVVANHAISLIRSKVGSDEFGYMQDFVAVGSGSIGDVTRTVRSDFGWMRPSFILDGDHAGMIDIFSSVRNGQAEHGMDTGVATASEFYDGWNAASIAPLYGIPYNRATHDVPPRVYFTQGERFYPMQSSLVQESDDPKRPQYAWECMFRRYGGKVYVAIFVYRVSAPAAYIVPPNLSDPNVPPLPIALDLEDAPWDIQYDNGRAVPEVPGDAGTDSSWRAPRQWLLDQNNNVHRILEYRPADDIVELAKPLSPVRLGPDCIGSGEYANPAQNGWPTCAADEHAGDTSLAPLGVDLPMFDRGVVTRFWYVPQHLDSPDGTEYTLTPVYVSVQGL